MLFGDRFIGRLDPLVDRKKEKLLINAVYAESKAPRDKDVSEKIRDVIEQLSQFLGAKDVIYSKRVPRFWRDSLQ